MATKIRPLHDRVIVKRIEEEEKTKGGIIIPDTALNEFRHLVDEMARGLGPDKNEVPDLQASPGAAPVEGCG